MITRFDHTVIAVRDLDTAMSSYQKLGFAVSQGGQHPGMGTRNALIRFGLDYIELLTVDDPNQAIAARLAGRALVDFLQQRNGGPLGYALASDGLEQEAERLSHTNLTIGAPFPMQRMRPDGHLLAWRLLIPNQVAWRRPWPFLIQWDTPDEQRLAWEMSGAHPNGTVGWSGIAVAVRDLEYTTDLYRHLLKQEPGPADEAEHLAARRVRFQIGASSIELLQPAKDGPVQQMLEEMGEGPFEITLAVSNLEQSRAYLAQTGIGAEPYPTDSQESPRLLLDPQQALGVRLVLAQAAK
ncbi:MAG TPA: VOC family protein [Ktedonosporobacter sp.]|nr:VOC family protein [Ktedonosporobacter sp.]